MNRKLKPGKAALMWRLSFLLLALVISTLLPSCASRKPEAGESGVETSSTQENSLPAFPDGTKSKAGEGPESADSSEAKESSLEASKPVAIDGDSETADDEVAVAVPEAKESSLEASKPVVIDGDSETADDEVAVAVPEAADPGFGRDKSNPEAVEESVQPSVTTAPTTFLDQRSEALEINPLLADRVVDDLRGAEETPDATSKPSNPEINPPVVEVDPEQPGQPSEASSDPAILAATPTRILEAPGELTIILENVGWIFRSDRSTPGTWRFLGREIIGDSTSFRFLFSEIGKWNLVFERQVLSSGKSEEVIRRVAMDEADSLPTIENGPIPVASSNPIPGTLPADADARYAAALAAAAAGKTDEAIKYYEQDSSRNDSVGARARGALIETAAKSGVVGPLLTWLPRYLEDSPDPEVLRAALEVFSSGAGYDAQSQAILEELAESENNYPEWLYRLAVLLEKPGEERNLDRAARLYQEVITRWPLTKWRNRSEERLLWLQRHYFRVR